VNVIRPGPVDTPILSKLGITIADRPAFETGIARAIPLGRPGRPQELAHAALFLACGDSSFITGVTLNVDGEYFSDLMTKQNCTQPRSGAN
jgi:NAD(P)-dependent dehydrogenase (short-subunit alcohol dehydrogenase family)